MAGYDKTTKAGRKLQKELQKLEKLQVRVGFQSGNATADDGTDIADIAMWNELGTKHIPSRPFLRQSVDNNEAKIRSMCRTQFKELVQGKISAQEMLNKIGVMQKALVQETIKNGDFEPNAESTVRQKKSSKPLVDTGRMRQSVTYTIEAKESSE